jgi:hypothetical protein
MMCVNGCKGYRHDGPCEPSYDEAFNAYMEALKAGEPREKIAQAHELCDRAAFRERRGPYRLGVAHGR